ncbi:MAG: hypothetical protein Q9197_001655 [Variospora fuerteventurae]
MPEYGVVRTDHPPVLDAIHWLQPHLPNETEDKPTETWDFWLLSLLLTILLLLFTSLFTILKFVLTAIRAVVARLLLARRLELYLPASVVEGLHSFFHYIGYRGSGITETHSQTITRQEKELTKLTNAHVELDKLYQDSDATKTSLARQLNKLQCQHEELAQHTVIVEGQSERLTEELEKKAQEFERMERWYLDKQAHFDGDTRWTEKRMKDSQNAADEANLSAAARQAEKESLERSIESHKERDTEAKKQRAADADELETRQKKVNELKAHVVMCEQQNKANQDDIKKMSKEMKDHQTDAEELRILFAEETAKKNDLWDKLAAAKKKIEEDSAWEEVALKERIDDTADKGTQTEVEQHEAEEKVLQAASMVNDTTSTATIDQGTQTVVSDAKEAEEETTDQDETVDDSKEKLAIALKENCHLAVKLQDLEKLCEEKTALLHHRKVEKEQADAAKERAENERNLALSEKAEALAAVGSTKAECEQELNVLRSQQSIVDVVIAWAERTEFENSELRKLTSEVEPENRDLQKSIADLKKAQDSLEELRARLEAQNSGLAKLNAGLETRCARIEKELTEACQLRDGALQGCEGLQSQYQREISGRYKTEEPMRKEAKDFEEKKNQEIQGWQNENVSLNRRIQGLQAELAQGQIFKTSQTQEIDVLRKQLERAEAAIEKRSERIRELEQAALASRPPPVRRPGRATQAEHDKLVAAHEEVKKQLKTCENKVSTFDPRTLFRNEEGKWLAERRKLRETIEDLNKQLKGSRANNQSFQDIAQKHKAQCSMMEEQIKDLNEKIDQTTKQLDHLNSEVAGMRHEKDTLQGAIAELKQHKAKLVNNLNKQKKEVQDAEKRLLDDGEDDEEGRESPTKKQQKRLELDD